MFEISLIYASMTVLTMLHADAFSFEGLPKSVQREVDEVVSFHTVSRTYDLIGVLLFYRRPLQEWRMRGAVTLPQ